MENRLQYILLNFNTWLLNRNTRVFSILSLLCLLVVAGPSFAKDEKKKGLKVNSELFDIGFVAGVINIEDFTSEFIYGANITFKASEYFFLQYNYLNSSVGVSPWEEYVPGGFIIDGRKYVHYDLLVGYNLFQGEFFSGSKSNNISNLYLVGGFGETQFGGEDNFSYTVGVGYLVEFNRKWLARVDYRDYIYETTLVVPDQEVLTHNNQISFGVGYLF